MSEQGHRAYRVLVAEDDSEMRKVVTEALRASGYQVIEAEHGGRMLADVAARLGTHESGESLDLIVSDVRMPVCTGLQLLTTLRQAHWATPVILMTAFGDEAVRARADALGALLFDKPFDVDDLLATAARLLPPKPPR
ncbi:MAG: response regulator [Polyangiaceae bacterium]|jgi:CheY-like chemotaxis protein